MLGAAKQKGWLSDQSFVKKFGFKAVDSTHYGYELLALSFDGTAPQFAPNAKSGKIASQDLTLYYDLQLSLIHIFFGERWAPTAADAAYGILPFLLTSIYGTAGAIVLGVPLGLMTAIFLAKIAPPKVARVTRAAVSLLAGIPSVVYGLVGMIVLVPAIRDLFGLSSGACMLAAILVLAVMILPSIVNVSETALRAVPPEYLSLIHI